MNQPCRPPLKTNPFTTYRDPKTGRWQVILAEAFSGGSDRLGDSITDSLATETTRVSAEGAIALDTP